MKTKPRANRVLKAINLHKKGMSVRQIASALRTHSNVVRNALVYHRVIKVKTPVEKLAAQQKMLRNKLRKAETVLRNLRRSLV